MKKSVVSESSFKMGKCKVIQFSVYGKNSSLFKFYGAIFILTV